LVAGSRPPGAHGERPPSDGWSSGRGWPYEYPAPAQALPAGGEARPLPPARSGPSELMPQRGAKAPSALECPLDPVAPAPWPGSGHHCDPCRSADVSVAAPLLGLALAPPAGALLPVVLAGQPGPVPVGPVPVGPVPVGPVPVGPVLVPVPVGPVSSGPVSSGPVSGGWVSGSLPHLKPFNSTGEPTARRHHSCSQDTGTTRST
jgi:hypothetical protein